MKKVLVLAAALALFATPALAGSIKGTKHDLSSSAVSPGYNGTITEICVYCHTPHGANTSIKQAPLWNRSTVLATDLYTGLDLNATTASGAGYGLPKINNTDAPLCLSCHDGASLGDALNNEPNASGWSYPDANIGQYAASQAKIGTDLSNDHPIGFNYDAVDTPVDEEIIAMSTVTSGDKIKFYGAGKNEMWCSSCHDVHNNTNAPFLNVTIGGSQLCLTCHKK